MVSFFLEQIFRKVCVYSANLHSFFTSGSLRERKSSTLGGLCLGRMILFAKSDNEPTRGTVSNTLQQRMAHN